MLDLVGNPEDRFSQNEAQSHVGVFLEWSREMLLDAWMSDPLHCCEKSGVTPPSNLFSEKPIVAESLSSPTQTDAPNPFAEVSKVQYNIIITQFWGP